MASAQASHGCQVFDVPSIVDTTGCEPPSEDRRVEGPRAGYNQTLSGSGGSSPYTLSATTGALPAGLSLTSDGVLSGIPTSAGASDFKLAATDADAHSGYPRLTMTIAKAVLTVSAADASRAYGAPNPGFTASYGGFVNNDSSAVLGGSPSLTTSSTER